MFFWTAKILWTLFSPLHLLALIMLAGLVLESFGKRAGRSLLCLGATLFLFFGFMPVGPNLMVWLETRYEKPKLPPGVDGIIVLGGAFNSYQSEQTKQLSVNEHAERMISFVELAQKYPQAKLVFTGGSGHMLQPTRTESEDAKDFFNAIGFNDERVTYETRSRNTYENAIYSKETAQPKEDELWVMITSASHMRRAAAVFKKAGWDVIAYPVDPETGLDYDWRAWPITFVRNFDQLETAMKEIIGYWAYEITGKSI